MQRNDIIERRTLSETFGGASLEQRRGVR